MTGGREAPESTLPDGLGETGGKPGDVPDYAAFGLDLFRRLGDAQPDGNVVISPLSAGLALGMLANGATGGSRAGILQALATGMDVQRLNAANAALSGSLASGDVQIAIANSLWMRGASFLPGYVAESRRIYGAEVAELSSAGPVNDWVSRSTGGRITEMVSDPLDPLLILLLLNAVYLKGAWQDEFSAYATHDRTFHAPSGAVERPMMSRTGVYGVLRAGGVAGVRLPYRGGRFAMYVLLPDPGRTLGQVREALSPDAWGGWMRGFHPGEVQVVMPRYRVSTSLSLNEPLKAMGMADAFTSGRAALDGMLSAEYVAQVKPYVSVVLQKVFVEVNEQGTEAAAVTMVAAMGGGMRQSPPQFVVDRPFLVAIRDDQTGALLFVGQVNDPVTQ